MKIKAWSLIRAPSRHDVAAPHRRVPPWASASRPRRGPGRRSDVVPPRDPPPQIAGRGADAPRRMMRSVAQSEPEEPPTAAMEGRRTTLSHGSVQLLPEPAEADRPDRHAADPRPAVLVVARGHGSTLYAGRGPPPSPTGRTVSPRSCGARARRRRSPPCLARRSPAGDITASPRRSPCPAASGPHRLPADRPATLGSTVRRRRLDFETLPSWRW